MANLADIFVIQNDVFNLSFPGVRVVDYAGSSSVALGLILAISADIIFLLSLQIVLDQLRAHCNGALVDCGLVSLRNAQTIQLLQIRKFLE